MSWEGYEQQICANGHYAEDWGDIGDDVDHTQCVFCNASIAWSNTVDDTNCEQEGVILPADMKKFIVIPAVCETCPTCAHTKQVSPDFYRIPTKEETESVRSCKDGDKYVHYPKKSEVDQMLEAFDLK